MSHDVSPNLPHTVRDILPSSLSASFDPLSLLFPFSSALSLSSAPLSLSSSSFPTCSTLAPSAPPPSVPIFSLPWVLPSVLSVSSAPLAPPPAVPSFASLSSDFPSVSFSGTSSLAPSVPPLASASSSTPLLPPPAPAPPAPSSFWPSSSVPPSSAPGVPPGFSALPSSSPFSGDFASFQARVLGLSDEYQALGRWFVAFGGFQLSGVPFCSFSSP